MSVVRIKMQEIRSRRASFNSPFGFKNYTLFIHLCCILSKLFSNFLAEVHLESLLFSHLFVFSIIKVWKFCYMSEQSEILTGPNLEHFAVF